ncbi:hypothetical protein BKA69DRAFT_471067 [Paraphysoderma sedebokerense]|nr:hypothetical protein BKA69DRAFT_471067 [Paraphysoderma sedebokerense]
MLRSITDRFTAIFRPSNGANGSDLNTDEASQTVDREQAIRDFESPAIARSTLYFGPHFVVKQGNGRNGNGYASANAALMNELLQNAQNTAAMTAGMLNVWENTRRRQQNGSPTEIQTTSTTLHSLVNIRKSSLRLSPVSSPTAIDSPQGLTVNTKLREPNQLYNLEFIFDSSVDCRITVHWLVTETFCCSNGISHQL